jgi:hypothetical protein
MAYDGSGNLFIADSNNHTIRKVVVASGEVTTLAGSPKAQGSVDGTGSSARFRNPIGVVYDGSGNLFVADYNDHTIRKVVAATGEVTTAIGKSGEIGIRIGSLNFARLNKPYGLAFISPGVFAISDIGENAILLVSGL